MIQSIVRELSIVIIKVILWRKYAKYYANIKNVTQLLLFLLISLRKFAKIGLNNYQ